MVVKVPWYIVEGPVLLVRRADQMEKMVSLNTISFVYDSILPATSDEIADDIESQVYNDIAAKGTKD